MGLKTFLKTNREARRIFGKKEIVIMLKQLDGIALTQSERNRLSRDIKPKLRVINGISAHQEEFAMKKNQEARRLMKKAVEVMLQDRLGGSIKAILLFGSYADNSFTFRSDIDLCAIFDTIDLTEATKFRIRIHGQLPDNLDIQVFNGLPQKIKKSIAANHRVLFERGDFDNVNFSLQFGKYQDYFARMGRVFGET